LESALADAGVVLPEQPERPQFGLPPGTPAPSAIAVARLTGDVVTLNDVLNADTQLLLVFTSVQCGPCKALLPRVGEWQRVHEATLRIAVIVVHSQ
jgi:hypothetical protein